MVIRICSILAALLMLTPPLTVRAEILEQILVKVNGEILTKTEFEARQVQALRQQNPQAANLKGEDLRREIAKITPQLILEAIDEMLLLQRGKELGFKMNDQQFQSIVEQIRKENRLESDEAFQRALAQEGMTMTELRGMLEKQMIVSNVQRQEVMSKVGLTEEETRRYYDEHIGEFTKPGTVTLREIFVAVPQSDKGINVAADEAAKAKIEDIRRRVTTGGEPFGKVAAEASEAPSRANGGLIGPLNRNELTPVLQEMLSRMKPGDVSEPVRTQRGYAIFLFESATEPQVMSHEEARDRIAERLWEQKRRVELGKYLAKLRSQAIIEFKNEELKKAYESALRASTPASPPPAEAEAPARG
ncbi:MAG TPA: peptidylprolyl isomerase [Vicinamibacterales bacterium]|nr:peptidylprolyl isomerase [Vicinamibacterales bacterium]